MARRIIPAPLATVVLCGLYAHAAAASSASALFPIAEFIQPPLPQVAPNDSVQPSHVPGGLPVDQKPIGALTTDIQPTAGQLPTDNAATAFSQRGMAFPREGASRGWAEHGFLWEASALCHRPLYFEEVNLERHGYSFGCAQPLVSAAHFFGSVPALPYLRTVNPPRKCIYTLGYRRPGSCTPHQRHRTPLSVKAGLVEGAAVTGLIFLIP